MNNSDNTFLKRINFSQIKLWDYNSQFLSKVKSLYPIVELGGHINEEVHKVSLSSKPNTEFKILGISNEIGMFDAYKKLGKEFNQEYKEVRENWIAYNPYRINVGSIGLKTKDLENELISPSYVVFSCKETLMAEFVLFILKSEYGNNEIRRSTTGSVRQILGYDKLSSLRIPLPPIEEQREMMNRIRELEDEIEILQKALHTHTHTVCEDILFRELGIVREITKKQDSQEKFVKFLMFSNMNSWDVKSIIQSNNNNFLNSTIFKNVTIKNIAQINPITKLPKEIDISFVPMEAVSGRYGEISKIMYRNSSLAKGYKKFQEDDICWAKITPCMENGKSFLSENLLNNYGIGSTEFHVVRVFEKNKVNPKYLFYLLRTPIVREKAINYFTGTSGQKRVRKEFIENLEIPLPNYGVQTRIVGLIDDEYKKTKNVEIQFAELSQKRTNMIKKLID